MAVTLTLPLKTFSGQAEDGRDKRQSSMLRQREPR